jgi:hypothetical protein
VWEEVASGAQKERPQLQQALDSLRAGDTLVVWRLDRLGRSLSHLIETVGLIESKGAAFRSLTEGIDTSTPTGRLVFHIFSSLAEFERELVKERTLAGLPFIMTTAGNWPSLTPIGESIAPTISFCGGDLAPPMECVLNRAGRPHDSIHHRASA